MTAPYIRSKSIGGSDVGVILGLSRWNTPGRLYDQLMAVGEGQTPDEEPSETGDMKRGKMLEPLAVSMWEEETGRKALIFPRITHPDLPFLHASPDRIVPTDGEAGYPVLDRNDGLLEVKCPRSFVVKRYLEDGIEPSYWAQVQHYLYVLGLQWGEFAILDSENWKLHRIPFERDEVFIANMVDAVTQWWERHILAEQRPDEGFVDSNNRPWPKVKVHDAVEVDGREWLDAVEDLRRAREAFSLAEHAKELAEERVKTMMGDKQHIVIPGKASITFKEGSKRSFDLERFKQDHPDLDYNRYVRQTITRTFRPTFK